MDLDRLVPPPAKNGGANARLSAGGGGGGELGSGRQTAQLPGRSEEEVGSGRIFQAGFDVELKPGGIQSSFLQH